MAAYPKGRVLPREARPDAACVDVARAFPTYLLVSLGKIVIWIAVGNRLEIFTQRHVRENRVMNLAFYRIFTIDSRAFTSRYGAKFLT